MSEMLYLKVNPGDVNYINRIMEGFEYLGVVSTIDRAEGLLMVRTTPDTFEEAREVLSALPVKVEFLKSV